MKQKYLFSFVLSAALIFFGSTAVFAAVFTVTKATDTSDGICDSDCSLREAVAAAAGEVPGETIVVFSPSLIPATIVLTQGEIDIGGVNIIGPGADRLTISGNNSSRIFFASSSMYLSGMTVTGGNGVGQTFQGVAGGGALLAENGGVINAVNFVGNTTLEGNGRAAFFGIFGKIYNCTFSGNPGAPKAVVFISSNQAFAQPVYNSTFVEDGIALSVDSAVAELRNSTVLAQLTVGFHSQITAGNSIISSIEPVQPLSLFFSKGHNVITTPAPAGTTVSYSFTDLLGVSPQFSGTLSYNGGNIPTVPLAATSPGVDGADNSLVPFPTDQRGYLRLVNGTSDIGAYEVNSNPLPNVNYAGRVVDLSGRFVPGATVTVIDRNGNVQSQLVSPLGYFSFSDLVPGQFFVLASAKRHRPAMFSPQVNSNVTDANVTVQ